MAFALTRAAGQLRLASAAPRLFQSRLPVVPRPRISVGNVVAVRPLRAVEIATVAFAATTTRGSKSAEKRHRQSEKRRLLNRSRKSEIRTRMKKVFRALEPFKTEPPKAVADLEPVEPLLRLAFKAIDKAVQKGTLHRNTGNRRKSRLTRARQRILVEAGLATPPPKPPATSLLEQYYARKQAKRDALKTAAEAATS